ncbi:protein kinase domain-containing protein [Micromonospora craniellae]|uniref:non-specific serine/threonine protein kinase n=1 Tax=Micromonospora craniellae TaxID=2294034 RepID=A0A372G510_9ACTN|nr:protein kinase [Micromonospora craniellae]QOC90518.1 protein kinase [Micromonospora craniellae]RFS48095.1 serine/threonine protein kinase [Micromonospora craniellae]
MKPALQPGRLLATRYRLIDQVGAGGMSVIWRAHDEVLDRMVALKVLAPSLAADARFRDMVRDEARAAAALVHPHVTSVHDYGETVSPDGSITSFVVMELLTGEELEFRLTEGPLPWPEAVEIGAQVADALAAAHRLGVVHRDVTTANVMMTQVGAKVLDFGIATRIGAPDDDEDGATFGTPAYVAPERLDGAPTQPATDVYSLGVLLYEMLTGRVPYPADTWDELSLVMAEGAPPTLDGVPGLPPTVARVCLRCLSRDPADRPTARQVASVLRDQMLPADPQAATMLAPTVTLPALTPARATATLGPAAHATAGPAVSGADGPGTSGPADAPTTAPAAGGPATNGHQPGTRSPDDAGPATESRRRLLRPVVLVPAAVLVIGAALLVPALLPEPSDPPAALPTPQPSASAGPTVPDDTPSEQPSAAPPTTSAAPPPTSAAPTRPSRPDTLVEAANRIDQVIGAGLADGGIRDDVALDLRNELRNLTRAVSGGNGQLGPEVARLREKVATRLREEGLSPAYARQLDAAITALGAAQV